MNKGKLPTFFPTNFCAGVAGYPEKHFEAPNEQADLRTLKQKVDMGAQYILTQMFFDNALFFSFVEKCRAIGINVPIIPGLKPITGIRQLIDLPRTFHVSLPDELVQAVSKAKNKEAVKTIGIEWCSLQTKELRTAGVPCIHYYTMSRPESTESIIRACY